MPGAAGRLLRLVAIAALVGGGTVAGLGAATAARPADPPAMSESAPDALPDLVPPAKDGDAPASPDLAAAAAAAEADPATARLRAHLAFLADDALAGRLTGSPGYAVAARYVASQLQQLGLRPLSPAGYLLPVPMRESRLVAGSAELEAWGIGGGRGKRRLRVGRDFVMSADAAREVSEARGRVVFVGYGIAAPDLGWDDYAGLDVRGAVVLMMHGKPESLVGDAGAYHGSSDTKEAAAVAHGAIGVLRFRPGSSTNGSWERIAKMAGSRPSIDWLQANGELRPGPAASLLGQAGISEELAAELLASRLGAPVRAAEAVATAATAAIAAARAAPGKGFALTAEVRLARRSTHRRMESANVAALLPGADPALAGEVVVFSAHLDHLGERERGPSAERQPGSGDTVYNGYYDNAMGNALLLEAARALAEAPQRPRRSVVFLALTGEEQGLLGSEQFAAEPPPGIGKLVAEVNLDMPLFLFPMKEVVAFGSEHSTLRDIVAAAAAEAGLALAPDPIPEELVFVRSDQYAFVRHGVPAVMLMPGLGSADPGVDGPKLFQDFLKTRYHSPGDDASQPVDWASALRFLRVNETIGRRLADAEERPEWLAGDFFGETFARDPARSAAPAAPAASSNR